MLVHLFFFNLSFLSVPPSHPFELEKVSVSRCMLDTAGYVEKMGQKSGEIIRKNDEFLAIYSIFHYLCAQTVTIY